MTAFELLVDAVRSQGRDVKDTGHGKAQAQCPAHDDSRSSLSIGARKDGKGVVVYCHAGCSAPDVVAALGWSMRDLFDSDDLRQIYNPRRDYQYPDGRVVHRKPDKSFPQSGNTHGRSLFHADRIADAETVYVVEGEKDVESIESVGGTAVCSAMGAGKAHLADWSPLRGKHAIVVADKDEPGHKHAAEVAEQLGAVQAASVTLVEAAVGKDAADHIAADRPLDQLVALAGPAVEKTSTADQPEGDEKAGRRSVAARLVDLARADYALGVTDTDDPFGVTHERPHIALMLRGGRTGLRAELARQFFAQTNTVASQQALADACCVLEGLAAQQTAQRVYLRVAEKNGAVYVDMGDTAGRVIEICGGRWRVIDTAPVLFRRTKLTGELPDPHPGDLSKLWEFVGVDDEDRPLVLAVLVAALIQVDVPHVILALLAEQGSAKSTVTRLLVSLIDPSGVPLRQPPRDPDGWVTAASASWVVALDNLSGLLQPWLSDCLCRASTGDGSVKRALYTDHDVAVMALRRCVILNGVDLIVDRGDLAERVLPVDLRRVKTRRPEDELVSAWDTARAGIFGGLLDLAANVHHRLPAIEVADLPRMADFAKVLAAVDEALGVQGLQRYRERSQRAAADTLDAPFIAELVAAKTAWSDKTSAELLSVFTQHLPDGKLPRGWPKNARTVTGLLTRHAPALRTQGWLVDNDSGCNKQGVTRWTVTPPEERGKGNPPNPPNPPAQVNGHKLGGPSDIPFPATNPPNPPAGNEAGQAGYAKTADPPRKPTLTSGDGVAGQAGHEYRQSLVISPCCRHCQASLLPEEVEQGHCPHPDCIAAETVGQLGVSR